MNFLNNFGVTFDKVIPILIKLIFVFIVFLMILAILELINENYKQKKIKGTLKQKTISKKIKQLKFIENYSNHLELVLKEKNKEGLFATFFYGSLFLIGVSMLSLVLVKQILLAIICPVILLRIFDTMAIKLSSDIIESIEEQLPFAIDNIIRISTKYGDIKSIIYEASRTCENPIKSILESISREMISSPPDEVLLDYAEKYDNVWFYSFVFTIISYLEDASKEETIKNLKHLRNMLEKENTLKKANLTDKKYSIVINYMIIVFSILGFVANLIINPSAKAFFFSTFIGLVCFIAGCGCIVGTIFVNITMSKNKK